MAWNFALFRFYATTVFRKVISTPIDTKKVKWNDYKGQTCNFLRVKWEMLLWLMKAKLGHFKQWRVSQNNRWIQFTLYSCSQTFQTFFVYNFVKEYAPIFCTSPVHLSGCGAHKFWITLYIVRFLEENDEFNNNQYCFRIGRSCLSQLLIHFDNIVDILETGSNVDAIYLDFAKAFDKVDRGI